MSEYTIGQAAQLGGISDKMIRHYESIGLISEARRTQSGYRMYSETDVHNLRFIRQARTLGFSIEQIKQLLNLWKNQRRSSRKVKELAQGHIDEISERIRELTEMKQLLEHLVHHCHGDDRPQCPIIDELSSPQAPPKTRKGKPERQLKYQ